MKLIIIHGPPASGKLTISKALSEKTGYRVLHNHLTVDLALEVYPEFGSNDFFEFVADIRYLCIEKACVNKIEGLIVTVCYDKQLDKNIVERWVELLESHDGLIIPIYLKTSRPELKKRVSNESRVGTNKLQTISSLETALNEYSFGAIEKPESFVINTELKTVSESVNDIIENIQKEVSFI